MCEICRQSPCAARCPNADEPEVVCYCDECGGEIREWDGYYQVHDMAICEECMSDMHTTAEFEEYIDDDPE